MPTLGTGTAFPTGPIPVTEDLYITGGPRVFFQPYYNPSGVECAEAYNPDSDSFYHGLSGTSLCPIYELGCYEDFQIIDTITRTPVSCDSLGTVDEIMRRDSMELQFTMKSLLPFNLLTQVLNGGVRTLNATEETEKFGMGEVPDRLFHVYLARVYDSILGDYISFTGHRARFVEASPLSMPFAEQWNISVVMKLFADRNKGATQLFGTWLRYDPSVL